MQYSFGSGILYGRSLESATPTPERFGALQGVSVDISFTTKELYGQRQYPLAIGRGTAKLTGRAQFAQFNARMMNDLFFGEASVGTGSVVTVSGEEKTITSNIVTATFNTNFVRDLGVIKASDGSLYERVSATPVGQQYTVNETTGVWTFNSSQSGNVKVSYNYTDTSNGRTITINNQNLGLAPQFMTVLTNTFQNKKLTLVLNACMSSKLTLPSRLEDFWIPDFDFQAFSDSADVVGKFSIEEL